MNKNEEDEYTILLNKAKLDIEATPYIEETDTKKIVRLAKYQAKISTILITLAILLLLTPLLTLCSYLYYGTGDRANELLDVTKNIVYVTEPNTTVESGIDARIGFFSMDATFNTLKRVGKQDVRSEEVSVHFTMNQPTSVLRKPQSNSISLNGIPPFIYPYNKITIAQSAEWEVLNGLPSGTVAELYISLDSLYSPEEVERQFSKNMDTVWFAVDTGVESSLASGEGERIKVPLGYPAHPDSNYRSPFFSGKFIGKASSEGNESVFLEIIEQMTHHQEVLSEMTPYKSISISERSAYLQQTGVQIYGLVVTGPVDALRNLKNNAMVRIIKVGEVELWNWHS